MGNELRDKESKDAPERQRHLEFSSNLSKLLDNFSSASLVTEPATPTPQVKCGCSDIESSLRAVHIRQPVSAKQRLRRLVKRSNAKSGAHSLNLAIAASHHQRPLLWPARLAKSMKPQTSKLLRPSRLTIQQTPSDQLAIVSKGCVKDKLNQEVVSSLRNNTALDLAHASSSLQDCMRLPQTASGANRLFGSKNCKATVPASSSSFKELSLSHSDESSQQSESFKFASSQHYRMPFNSSLCSQADSSRRRHSSPASQRLPSHGAPVHQQVPTSLSALDSTASSLSSALPPSESEGALVNRSCSQEMRMEETNVNELASYFEDFLHIPRKMSTMAEMMYA